MPARVEGAEIGRHVGAGEARRLQSVGVELAGRRRHQRRRPNAGLHLVERSRHIPDAKRVEAVVRAVVFASRADIQDEDRVSYALQGRHAAHATVECVYISSVYVINSCVLRHILAILLYVLAKS